MTETIVGIFLLVGGILAVISTSQVRFCPKTNRGVNKIVCKNCSFGQIEYCKKEDRGINITVNSIASVFIIIGILLIWGVF